MSDSFRFRLAFTLCSVVPHALFWGSSDSSMRTEFVTSSSGARGVCVAQLRNHALLACAPCTRACETGVLTKNGDQFAAITAGVELHGDPLSVTGFTSKLSLAFLFSPSWRRLPLFFFLVVTQSASLIGKTNEEAELSSLKWTLRRLHPSFLFGVIGLTLLRLLCSKFASDEVSSTRPSAGNSGVLPSRHPISLKLNLKQFAPAK